MQNLRLVFCNDLKCSRTKTSTEMTTYFYAYSLIIVQRHTAEANVEMAGWRNQNLAMPVRGHLPRRSPNNPKKLHKTAKTSSNWSSCRGFLSRDGSDGTTYTQSKIAGKATGEALGVGDLHDMEPATMVTHRRQAEFSARGVDRFP